MAVLEIIYKKKRAAENKKEIVLFLLICSPEEKTKHKNPSTDYLATGLA